jgi:hypothetical protein
MYKVKEKYTLYIIVVPQSPWYMLNPASTHLSTNYADWKRGTAVVVDASAGRHGSKRPRQQAKIRWEGFGDC